MICTRSCHDASRQVDTVGALCMLPAGHHISGSGNQMLSAHVGRLQNNAMQQSSVPRLGPNAGGSVHDMQSVLTKQQKSQGEDVRTSYTFPGSPLNVFSPACPVGMCGAFLVRPRPPHTFLLSPGDTFHCLFFLFLSASRKPPSASHVYQ